MMISWKITLVGIIMLAVAGCTTVSTTARNLPDGTRELKQKISVTAGGKIEEGMLDFTAESIGADGSNWIVTSGTGGLNAQSPNVIRDMTGLVEAVGGIVALQTRVPETEIIEDFDE